MGDTLQDIMVCFGYPEDAWAWLRDVPRSIELVFILAMTYIYIYIYIDIDIDTPFDVSA